MTYSPQLSSCRPTHGRTARPAMNVLQAEDRIELQFAVPGFRKEQLGIRVEEGLLHVEGKADGETRSPGLVRREFGPIPFHKSFRLSERVDASAIQARVEDGVLTVTIGLKQPLRREIAVA
jgi:HSP20 family protein